MGIETMQNILCRAAVDAPFLATLLDSPKQALRQYDLSPAEADVFAETSARSLVELAGAVEAWRRGEFRQTRTPVRELALAG
jgi:hypothetical protein